MQEQVFGLKCAFFYILTEILPRSVEGKLSAPLPSRTSFGYGSFAVVLALWHFLAFFLPVEICRIVPNCELETGIMPVIFNPR